MKGLLSFLLGFTITIGVMGTLNSCGGGGSGLICNPQQPSSESGWTNFGLCGQTFQVGTSFQIGSTVIGYVTEPTGPLNLGQTITLNYTVTGTPNYIQNDKGDSNPASVTLFIWERGDNLQDPQHRWWCPTRGSLDPGAHTLSCVIDNSWTNVNAGIATGNPGWTQALANAAYVGFTFGGANFYGHGITSNPSVNFSFEFGIQ